MQNRQEKQQVQQCFALPMTMSYKMLMLLGSASKPGRLLRPGWVFWRQALDSRQAGIAEFGCSTEAKICTAGRRGLVNVSNAGQMRAPCSGTKMVKRLTLKLGLQRPQRPVTASISKLLLRRPPEPCVACRGHRERAVPGERSGRGR